MKDPLMENVLWLKRIHQRLEKSEYQNEAECICGLLYSLIHFVELPVEDELKTPIAIAMLSQVAALLHLFERWVPKEIFEEPNDG